MAVPPRTRTVKFYQSPTHIVTDGKGAETRVKVTEIILELPVQAVNARGRDVVKLPNGNLLELP